MSIIYFLREYPVASGGGLGSDIPLPVGKVSKRNAQTTHAIEYPVNFELIYENNALGYSARNIKVNVRQNKCIGVLDKGVKAEGIQASNTG